MKNKLAYLIVTYNGERTIEQLLSSIAELGNVLVIDNASADATLDRVGRYPVQVVRNTQNKGYATAINQGLQVLRAEYEYVFVLNQDTVIKSLPETQDLELLEKYAIVQPLILLPDGTVNVDQLVMNVFGYVYPKNFKHVPTPTASQEIPFFSGAAFIINLEKYQKIGNFDESFFLYYEDVEYAFRCLLQNEKILLDPRIIVEHAYQSSWNNAPKLRLLARNRKRIIQRYFSSRWRRLIFVQDSLSDTPGDLTEVQRGDLARKLKPHLALGFHTRQIPLWQRFCMNLFLVPYSWLVKNFLS